MTANELIEDLIATIRKEVLSWRKTGTPAIANRLEQVIRERAATLASQATRTPGPTNTRP